MVSIIVPVYNSSRYLPQCVESILKQDYSDFELILVDDASTDKSRKLEETYEKKDQRVVCIYKTQNKGVDYARFSGLSVARGEYIMFVDSDDWLASGKVLGKMVQTIEETGVDYVETRINHVMDRHGFIKHISQPPKYGIIKQPELFNEYYISFFGCNILSVSIWAKLYRKSTIDKANITPTGFRMGEDLFFNLKLFPHLESIFIMNDVGYNYRFGGMTSKYNPTLLSDLKKSFVLKNDLAKKYNYDQAYDYLRAELKNVFRSDICQQIIFLKAPADQIINNISKELEDPVYQKISEVKSFPHFQENSFVKAILNKDAESVYKQCKDIVDRNKWQRQFKKFISSLLRII